MLTAVSVWGLSSYSTAEAFLYIQLYLYCLEDSRMLFISHMISKNGLKKKKEEECPDLLS